MDNIKLPASNCKKKNHNKIVNKNNCSSVGCLPDYMHCCVSIACSSLTLRFFVCVLFVYPMKNKQLLDEVFVISGIIKVEVSDISRSRRLRLITLTETLIISDITKTESNNCFIIHCFKENNDKRIIAPNTVYFRHAMFLLRCP